MALWPLKKACQVCEPSERLIQSNALTLSANPTTDAAANTQVSWLMLAGKAGTTGITIPEKYQKGLAFAEKQTHPDWFIVDRKLLKVQRLFTISCYQQRQLSSKSAETETIKDMTGSRDLASVVLNFWFVEKEQDIWVGPGNMWETKNAWGFSECTQPASFTGFFPDVSTDEILRLHSHQPWIQP